jgi:redox-sensitive bicupin YhaK (pirin superfamily)
MTHSASPAPHTERPAQPQPRFRPAAGRFHSQLEWLDSRHSFSFGEHHDPAWMGFGPLRVINDDVIAAGKGFGMHPHRDMEIVTVMVEGDLSHRDSLGHQAVLRAGEVQRMSAGTGVLHSEWNEGSGPCRLLQIWIEPERRGLAPDYEQKPFAFTANWTPLLDPDRGNGALAIARRVWLWRARPAAGERLSLPSVAADSFWLQLIDGSVRHSGGTAALPAALPAEFNRGDGLGFAAGQLGELVAGSAGADLLLFALT